MANSLWTIEEFTCPGCSMNYTATREEHAEPHAGSFKCSICSGVVHSWSGKHHFFGWQAVKTKPAVFGRREHRDVDLDLSPVGWVRDHAGPHLARRPAEDRGIGRDRVVAADRFEMRSRYLGQETCAGSGPDG